MEPTGRKITSKLPRLTPHLRQAIGIGFSAMTVLMLVAFPAQGQGSFMNGSFQTVGTGITTSTNITGPAVTPIVIPGWNTTTDGIGCVVFPGTAKTNVCGAGRFGGSTLISDPGPVPGGGNYVLIDGSPVSGQDNSNTTTLYQIVTGLTQGAYYNVTFWQAAAQFTLESGTSPTTEQWLVSFDTGYSSSGGACDPTILQYIPGTHGCQSQFAPPMSTPGSSSTADFQAWAKVTMTFLAQATQELLGFFARGTPGGEPPIVLLGGISLTGQNGYIEVCKASCPTNPLTSNDPANYYFTVPGSAFSSPPGIQVPVGECSGPIPVSAGMPTIKELPTPGVGVCDVTAVGYSLSAGLTNLLVPGTFNPTTGTAEIIVQAPPSAADTSLETIVTFYNYKAPPAELKVCKIAGAGVPVGTFFNFTISPSMASVPVEAGPLNEGGYCVLVPGTFQVGTSVTVTETVPTGDAVPAITVNGVSTPSTGCTPSTSAAFPCGVVAAIGPGINEVSFTNCSAQSGQFCRTGIVGENQGHQAPLRIVNYSLVSQRAVAGTRSYATYQADLLNTGTDVGPLMARLRSLDPTSVQVMGEGALNFESVPADSQVTSSNTFTILIDSTVPFDFSKLNWTFHSRRSVPPRR
jgi:hypothetical protein